jgi:bacterioferritin-associated ferredoxin
MIKYTIEHICDSCGSKLCDTIQGELMSSAVPNYRLPMVGNIMGFSSVCNTCFDFAAKALHTHRQQQSSDLH